MNETQVKLLIEQLLADMKNRFQVESEEIRSRTEEQFQALLQSLNNLNDLTNRYYEVDQDGNLPIMDNAALVEFERQYSDAIKRCNDFNQTMKSAGAEDMEMNQLVGKVANVLQTDIKSIMKIDVRRGRNLPAALSEARTLEINIGNQELSTAGNVLSSRGLIEIPTADGERMKGFFTSDDRFDMITPINQYLDRLKQSDMNEDDKKTYVEIVEKIRDDDRYAVKFHAASSDYDWTQKDLEGMGYSKQEAEKIFNSQSFKTVINDLRNAVNDAVDIRYRMYVGYGHGYNSYISKRNVGMSRMADMLGMPNILGRAENVQIKQTRVNPETNQTEEVVTTGVFMENVPGVDPYHMNPQDPVLSYGQDVYNTPQALENLADLQLLDYVCCNIDRHVGNVMLQFSGSKEHPVFDGVRGIDNDCSFLLLDAPDNLRNLGSVKNMKVISEKSYQMLNSITPEMVQVMMKDLSFGESEIKCVMTRIENVKNAVKNHDIEVVKEGDWAKYNLKDLAKGYNHFSTIADIRKNFLINGAFTDFKLADRDDILTGKDYENDVKQFQEITKNLDHTFRDKEQYRNFSAAVARAEKMARELAKDPSNYERGQTYQFLLEDLEKRAQEYVDYKEGHVNGNRAQNRLDATKTMKEFVHNRLPQFKKKLHASMENQMEQDMLEAKAKSVGVKLDAEDLDTRFHAANLELIKKPFRARAFAEYKTIMALKQTDRWEDMTEKQLDQMIQKLEKSEAMIKLAQQLEGKKVSPREMDKMFTKLTKAEEKTKKSNPQQKVKNGQAKEQEKENIAIFK